MPSMHSDSLWAEIKRLAEASQVKLAAVAYVTDDEIVKFGEDDLLVVDASDQAIGAGQTGHSVLQRAYDRGANLYCCPGLHAKILVFDDVAVLSSANLSRSSRDDLIEAGLVIDNAESVAEAKAFIERLATQCEQIDEEFLSRIGSINVVRRMPVSKRQPGMTTDVTSDGHDFYVTFGQKSPKSTGIRRDWEDARRYGFVSAGGKKQHIQRMEALSPGDRIFVYIPKHGYVGIGKVVEPACRIREFIVDVDGQRVPLSDAPLNATEMERYEDTPEVADRVVRVRWVATCSKNEALNESGLFYSQLASCALNDEKKRHKLTKQRVLKHFGLDR